MVAKPETLGRFIFNSDYPVDKIVWLYEGQLAVWGDQTQNRTVDIAMRNYSDTRIPIFVKGAYTLDDWQTSFMIGAIYSDPNGSSVSMSWTNYPDPTLLSLDFNANFPRFYPGRTIKYRLWGVCREDIALAVDYSKNASTTKTKLIFSTDRNYPRLLKDGIAKSGDVIEHNLGHIPYMDYWYALNANAFNSYWSYAPMANLDYNVNNAPGIMATDKTIRFRAFKSGGTDYDVYYYYRIYA